MRRHARALSLLARCFRDEPEYAHQPNECIKIENLVLAAKIYADAIYSLTKAD